ncbi:PD40 domain-containing protein [Cytophaga sp. FL35]|uniref:PD40 domain-containing protein n=1 Tax=Cytophaga sp. FL35 TaxID=1904456 RepID=UPI0016534EE0|nr:PD40 domain-containing protein [Cytophaga sp. FL35]MBC7000605.1 PD40 domain-containing protein [Cytophaga sp. FL35]
MLSKERLRQISIIFINLLIVASFFLHAEVIFNHVFEKYIIENLYDIHTNYYFNKANLKEEFTSKEFKVNYITNNQGYRIGSEDNPETTVKEVDWLFLGDSYTQGAQVEHEDLFSSKLYSLHPDKIILNAGISGFGVPQELALFNELKDVKPEIVFLQICNFNDFMNVKNTSSGVSDYLMSYSNFLRFILYDFKYSNPAELPLGRWTEPFYPDNESNLDFNIFYKDISEQKLNDIKRLKEYLKEFSQAVRSIGAELIIVQIPTKEQISYKYFDEVISSFHIDVDKLDMTYPNKLINEICVENDIKHIDLLDAFSSIGYDPFFEFDEHLNRNGHLLVANEIDRFLKNRNVPPNNIKKISPFNVGDRYPVPTGSNKGILYQSFRDGNMEIFISDSLMHSSQRLTWNNIDEIHPTTSPLNSLIAFTEGNQELSTTKVGIMKADGSERRYITQGENIFGAIPNFSSDGTKIAYAEWSYNPTNRVFSKPSIIVYDLIENLRTVITNDRYESWRPIFTPDNKSLIYISDEFDGQFDVFKTDLVGKSKVNLTNTMYDEWDPAISFDGETLIYAAKKFKNWDLFTYNFKTLQTEQLTSSKGDEWDPIFLEQSNSKVYYAAEYGLNNGIYSLEIK